MTSNDNMIDLTASQLLDYLASDGHGDQWRYYGSLADWEILYNLRREHRFIARLAENLVSRGLAERRRAVGGMQIRLTRDGIALAAEHQRRVAEGINLTSLDLQSGGEIG